MKSFCSVFIALLFIPSLSAQSYIPLIQPQARWQVSVDLDISIGNFDYFYEYTIGGDTLLNDTLYTNLLVHYFAKSTTDPGGIERYPQPFEAGGKGLAALIREDIDTKKVFARKVMTVMPLTFSEEFILYDFDLDIGDIWNGNLFDVSYEEQVTSIDTLLYDGLERRVWQFSSGVRMIEGVGSELGLLEGLVFLISGAYSDLYDYCNGNAMDCNVAVDGFVNTKRQFNIHVNSYSFTGNSYRKTYEYRFIDTVNRNGHTYFKLYERQEEEQPEFEEAPFFYTGNTYLFRQDDSSRVYRLSENEDSTEELIYDFNPLEPEQEIYSYESIDDFSFVDFTLATTDTITLLNNEKRLSFYLDIIAGDSWNDPYVHWVEGIGTLNHPFYPEYNVFPFIDGPSFTLQCYYENYEEDPVYIDENLAECHTYIVGVEELADDLFIELYPNPVQQTLHLKRTSPNDVLVLFDVYGRKINQYTMDKSTIDLSDLPRGGYFYQILTKNRSILQNGKLMKL